jgi:hypothetical protein
VSAIPLAIGSETNQIDMALESTLAESYPITERVINLQNLPPSLLNNIRMTKSVPFAK